MPCWNTKCRPLSRVSVSTPEQPNAGYATYPVVAPAVKRTRAATFNRGTACAANPLQVPPSEAGMRTPGACPGGDVVGDAVARVGNTVGAVAPCSMRLTRGVGLLCAVVTPPRCATVTTAATAATTATTATAIPAAARGPTGRRTR